MTTKQESNEGMSFGKAAAIGAGVAAVGAGAYALLGPNGKKNQKKAREWMTKMENETIKAVNKVKDIDPAKYYSMVDAIAVKYLNDYKNNEKEIKAFAKQLKSGWNKMKGPKTRALRVKSK